MSVNESLTPAFFPYTVRIVFVADKNNCYNIEVFQEGLNGGVYMSVVG